MVRAVDRGVLLIGALHGQIRVHPGDPFCALTAWRITPPGVRDDRLAAHSRRQPILLPESARLAAGPATTAQGCTSVGADPFLVGSWGVCWRWELVGTAERFAATPSLMGRSAVAGLPLVGRVARVTVSVCLSGYVEPMPGQGMPFDSERGRAAAARSAEVRRARAERKAALGRAADRASTIEERAALEVLVRQLGSRDEAIAQRAALEILGQARGPAVSPPPQTPLARVLEQIGAM